MLTQLCYIMLCYVRKFTRKPGTAGRWPTAETTAKCFTVKVARKFRFYMCSYNIKHREKHIVHQRKSVATVMNRLR